jgi:hypothetical protein
VLGNDPAPQIIARMHTLITTLRASERTFRGVSKLEFDTSDSEDDDAKDFGGDRPIVQEGGAVVLCEFA